MVGKLGGFAEELVWWCKPCRSVRMAHCAYPEGCGFMQQIPYHEASEKRYPPLSEAGRAVLPKPR